MYYKNYSRIRDRKKLTDYRVATDTGIARSTLSEWKKGLLTPNLKNMKILADYFGVSLDEMTKEN